MELKPEAKPNSMRYLKEAAADYAEAEERLASNVHNARRCGNSWEEIGKALGISKQTAFNRYNKTTTPKNEVQQHHDHAAKFLDGQEPAKRNKSRDHLYSPEDNAEADKALAALQGASKKLDQPAPAKPPMAKGMSKKGKTPALDSMTADPRPSFTLHSAGRKDGVAQPGTGKGPHACPRCGSTNHKSAEPHTIHAYPGECKPTKYDPQDIADVLTNYLKASK